MPSITLHLPPAVPGAEIRRVTTRFEGRIMQDFRCSKTTTACVADYKRGMTVRLSDSGIEVANLPIPDNKKPFAIPARPCDLPPVPEPTPPCPPPPRKAPNLVRQLAERRRQLGITGCVKACEDSSTCSDSCPSPTETSETESEPKLKDSENTSETNDASDDVIKSE